MNIYLQMPSQKRKELEASKLNARLLPFLQTYHLLSWNHVLSFAQCIFQDSKSLQKTTINTEDK